MGHLSLLTSNTARKVPRTYWYLLSLRTAAYGARSSCDTQFGLNYSSSLRTAAYGARSSCDTMLELSPCPHCPADWNIIGATQAIARGGTDILTERIGSA